MFGSRSVFGASVCCDGEADRLFVRCQMLGVMICL